MADYKYAVLCEDITHSVFVLHILPALVQQINQAIVVTEESAFPIMANNDDQVVRKCHDACKLAFVAYDVDLFVVGRDIDSTVAATYTSKEAELKQRLPERWKEKVILFLPVQCIEHWLLYLKQRRDNPETTKNEPVEDIPRHEAKHGMYGRGSTRKEYRATIVADHCMSADIEWLHQHSESFRRFAENVKTAIEHLNTTAQ